MNYKGAINQGEMGRTKVKREMVWDALEEIRNQHGDKAAFSNRYVAGLIAQRLGVPREAILNNVYYHFLRLIKKGVLVKHGSFPAQTQRWGRPRSAYKIAENAKRPDS